MPNIRFGHLQATPETLEKLRRFAANPKTRAVVSRKLNAESAYIAQQCKLVAEGELHRRPDDRRTPLSLAYGKHYVDSFEAVPAREVGANKLRVVVRNDHPAHPMVEKGTVPHTIAARNAKQLVFPYVGYPAGHGGPNTFAAWIVSGDKDTLFVGQEVQHPGAAPHEIMRRVLREYRRRAQRRLRSGS